nr:MFS transporter [Catenovulum sediminis]
MNETQQLKFKEKLGYGFGDFASSMFWKMFSVYLMIFYTDVFGISAAAVGTMFLVTRIWDTANDPIMGIVADRTNTRWGKFRPYLLWGQYPLL